MTIAKQCTRERNHLFPFLMKKFKPIEIASIFMPPLKKGAYCFATVGRSVGLWVCRPSVVRSISFDPFTWSIPNLVQGLPSMSRWSLLIFRSPPSVLSTILIPCLLALDTFCFYREDKPEICTMGGIYVSETFLVFFSDFTWCHSWNSSADQQLVREKIVSKQF